MVATLNEDCFVSESGSKFPEATSKRVSGKEHDVWKR